MGYKISPRIYGAAVAALIAGTALAAQGAPRRGHDRQVAAWAKRAVKSVVVVEYTAENELRQSKHVYGQGIVVGRDGVILISGDLIPDELPHQYIHKLKIRLPEDHFKAVSAEFLGRTKNHLFSFIKVKHPVNLPPLAVARHAQTFMGQRVFAVGRLGKSNNYRAYVGVDRVRFVMPVIHTIAATGSFGLTGATSPVFSYRTGKFLGIVAAGSGDALMLNMLGHALPVVLDDPAQKGVFYVYSSVRDGVKNVPTKPFRIPRPWLGLGGLTGLKPGLRHDYHIKQRGGVTIGQVVPHMPAAVAGLKTQDIVLTLNGKPFTHSSVASVMVQNFERFMAKCNVGQVVNFGVLRDGTKHLTIPVKMGALPRTESQVRHHYDRKLGIVTRNLVFADTYLRKLPQKQKGVMVVLVKTGAPAGLGAHHLHGGDLITRLDGRPVANEKAFMKMIKKDQTGPAAHHIVFVVIQPNGNTAVCRVNAKS